MGSRIFDRLDSIDESKYSWTIKVVATRTWENLTKETGELKAHNLILLDDKNNHMHAIVPQKIRKYFDGIILEGNMYQISNFVVKKSFGKLRPVSSQFLIVFTKATTVQFLDMGLIQDEDFFIPKHKFEIVNLIDVKFLAKNINEEYVPEYAYDVLGVVEDLQDVHTVNTNLGDMQLLKFNIRDGRCSHKVAIWGEMAAIARNMLEMEAQQLNIILITSTRIVEINGEVQIYSSCSTKVYVNLEYDDVIKMKNRLIHEGNLEGEDHVAN